MDQVRRRGRVLGLGSVLAMGLSALGSRNQIIKTGSPVLCTWVRMIACQESAGDGSQEVSKAIQHESMRPL